MTPDSQLDATEDQHASWMEDYEKEVTDGHPVEEPIDDEPPPQPVAAYTLLIEEERLGSESRAAPKPEHRRRPIKRIPDSSLNLKRAQEQLAQPLPVHVTSNVVPPAFAPPVSSVAPIAPPQPPPIVLPPFSAQLPPSAVPISTTTPFPVCAQPTPITRSFMREFGILRVGQGTRFVDDVQELQRDGHRHSGVLNVLKDRALVALRL